MARLFPLFVSVGLCVLGVAGCSRFDRAERPAWRNQAEEACLARHLVEASPVLQPVAAIDGPGICGLNHPFKVYALAGGTVRLNSASILDCSMIPTLDEWIAKVVQPDAQARFGEPVVQIDTMGTYSCRGINNVSGASLSEHAFGNAMDVGGFVLASGREINVMRGWKGDDPQASAFLHDAHAGACDYFTTVLGPGANIFHYNHVHMDLAMHGNTSRGPRRYCKPVPDAQRPAPQQDTLPDPPPIEEEMDIARTPAPGPAYAEGSGFVASAPIQMPPVRQAASIRRPPPAALALAPMPLHGAGDPDMDQMGGGPVPEGVPADWDITSLIRRDSR